MAETVPVGEMRGLESKHSFATITPGHLDQCLIFSSVRFPVTAPGKVTDLRHRQGGGGLAPHLHLELSKQRWPRRERAFGSTGELQALRKLSASGE